MKSNENPFAEETEVRNELTVNTRMKMEIYATARF